MGHVMADGHQSHGTTEVEEHSRFRARTEGTRERDVFRYLHPWIEMYKPTAMQRSAFPEQTSGEHAMHQPQACPDVALAAFAQLCAFRLATRRCFITLISSSTEYVLAEATRTMALQYTAVDDPKDEPMLGTCCFPRIEGLNSTAIRAWRKARQLRESPGNVNHYYTEGTTGHWCIISDLRGGAFQSNILAHRVSGSRFYFSIPLRAAAQGSVIGSVVVIDDRPRYGVSAQEMCFMEDLSDTISQHLYSTVVRSQRQRSERLIQGLGLFNNGQDTLRSWWEQQEDAKDSSSGRYTSTTLSAGERKDRSDREFGVEPARRNIHSHGTSTTNTSETKTYFATDTWTTIENSDAQKERDKLDVKSRDFDSRPAAALSDQPEFVGEITETGSKSDNQRLPGPPGHTKRKSSLRSDSSNFDIVVETAQTFARASNLLREALDAHGVVFVDSNAASSALARSRSQPESDSFVTSNTEAYRTSEPSDTDASDDGPSRVCKVLGFATRKKSSISDTIDDEHRFELSERYLSTLIKRYPGGHVFHYSERGEVASSSGEDVSTTGSSEDSGARPERRAGTGDGERLGKVMVGARSIAFYPLWDGTQQRWKSCSFVWSTTYLRTFDRTEDITYLAAWGHCLLAELSRLETLAADTAKATFISSVSHELRSPLHGVLAGVELLQDSRLTTFQQEMVSTISVSGRTLLDTINHILDYSKISSFTRARKKEHAKRNSVSRAKGMKNDVKSGEMDSASVVDLARLTEEAVECVISAHHFQSLSSSSEDPYTQTPARGSRDTRSRHRRPSPEHDGVDVILDIAHRDNWMVEMQPGGWTRIVTNLFGNALKYTARGSIEVQLELVESSDDHEEAEGTYNKVKLTIRDTGIGMSKQFLSHDAFTPFKQEDAHSTGTGLGLSIVKTIAQEMRGNLDISSEPGRGTQATLMFDAKFCSRSAMGGEATADEAELDYPKMQGKTMHLLTIEDRDYLPKHQHFFRSFSTTSRDWLGLQTSHGPDVDVTADSSYLALREQDLMLRDNEDPKQLEKMLSDMTKNGVRVVVIGSSVASSIPDPRIAQVASATVFINQPIGPRKLFRTLSSILEQHTPTSNRIANPHVIRSVPPSDKLEDQTKNSVLANRAKELVTANGSEQTPKSRRRTTDTASSSEDDMPPPLESSAARSRLVNVETVNAQRPDIVLLVEDNVVNMKLLKALMGKLEHKYQCAVNGREAYDAYKKAPASFVLILMDMSMPVLDGFEATAKIREFERKRGHFRCKIVALTGVTSADAKARAFDCGVDEYFPKPVRMKELKDLMARLEPTPVAEDGVS